MEDTGEEQTITTNLTSPAALRNITASAGGTADDIGAGQVVITGTNYADEEITETLPAFTAKTAGTVEGPKAFKTITSVIVPAHEGNGATTSIGWGDKLGLPYKLPHDTVQEVLLDNVRETKAPTVAINEAAIESNTITLDSNLNGKMVDIYLYA